MLVTPAQTIAALQAAARTRIVTPVDAVATAVDSACNRDDDAREAITLSSREASLSPIRLPIDDMGQFIYSPTVPKIDFDFDSHPAADELVGDALSSIVCGGFPVVT